MDQTDRACSAFAGGFVPIGTDVVVVVTDVDDKIIKRSSERKENGRPVTNVEFLKLARSYENDFFADLDLLGVLRPTAVARVSEHIEEIVDYIRTICDNGHQQFPILFNRFYI